MEISERAPLGCWGKSDRLLPNLYQPSPLLLMILKNTPAFTNRPRTPWGQKVSPSVIGKNLTRIVGEQIYPDGMEMPERGMAPVLQIGRMSVLAEIDAEWNAWYRGEYVPGYRKVPGVIYAR